MAKRSRKNKEDNIPPGITLRHVLKGHTDEITQLAWSPDGRILASGSYDETIRLWDGQTGRQINMLEGHTGEITSVSFSLERLETRES